MYATPEHDSTHDAAASPTHRLLIKNASLAPARPGGPLLREPAEGAPRVRGARGTEGVPSWERGAPGEERGAVTWVTPAGLPRSPEAAAGRGVGRGPVAPVARHVSLLPAPGLPPHAPQVPGSESRGASMRRPALAWSPPALRADRLSERIRFQSGSQIGSPIGSSIGSQIGSPIGSQSGVGPKTNGNLEYSTKSAK